MVSVSFFALFLDYLTISAFSRVITGKSLEELKANMEKSRKRMMGGRVIEENINFYRYLI